MKLNRVLVVFKHRVTSVSEETGSRRLAVKLAARQKQHDGAIGKVRETLKNLRIPHDFLDRDRISKKFEGDLIITVGGDGTFLAAIHAAGGIPILGVNSMPGHSVGFFCAATAENIASVLKKIRAGKIKPRSLPLLNAKIDGKSLPHLALNEILFASPHSAETSRYEIRIGKKSETQKSSGVWIAAGPGSTAATFSAGGKKMPLDSTRLQFLVREACCLPRKRYKLLRGILNKDEKISIVSEMSNGTIFIDGPRISHPIPFGSKLSVSVSRRVLKVFV